MPEPVTWLLPVRNGARYLEQTLASIAAQTYPHQQVIAWDNGSTDGTVDILRQWIGPQLRGLVVTDRPLSLGACLAQLVLMAPTELCARIDADDINLPHRLEKQVASLMKRPDVAVLGTNVQVIDAAGDLAELQWTHPTDDAEIRWRMRVASSMMHPTVLMRRSAILEAGNYRDIMPGQDYDLWLRVGMKHRLENLPDRLVRYRQHEQTVSTQSRTRGYITNRQLVERYTAELFPGLSSSDALRLHSLLTTSTTGRIAWRDVRNLRRTASLAAIAVDEPSAYFRRSPRYRLQFDTLLRRYLRQRLGLLDVDATYKPVKPATRQTHANRRAA